MMAEGSFPAVEEFDRRLFSPDDCDFSEFSALLRSAGAALYRDLPWRDTRDPYAVWISEVMLQQTQVSRVLGRWERFIGRFPTVDALASAAPSDVVDEWQGMGYNRRALALLKAAQMCSVDYGGSMPRSVVDLQRLPGVGKATAAGIMAFAYDEPSVYVETNVRAVFIHHFFPSREEVSDKLIEPLVAASCPREDVRGWYYAMLDYGSYLKKKFGNPARKAKAYSRQSAFEGSRRQKRAWVVREVLAHDAGIALDALHARLNAAECAAGRLVVADGEFKGIVDDLAREGFLSVDGGVCRML